MSFFIMSKHGSLKRGDSRDDGKIFYCYTDKSVERWVTIEKFDELEKSRKANRSANRERVKASGRKSYYKHKEKRSLLNKEWIKKNKRRFCAAKKEYRKKNADKIKSYMNKWRKENRDKLRRYQNNYYSERRKVDPIFNATLNIRGLIAISIKLSGFKKKTKTSKILGCSFEEFKSHLESKFKEGMSWENRHLWHIDHIMPVSMAKSYDEVVRLNHYKNLRPLWANENQSKGNKTPDILVLF